MKRKQTETFHLVTLGCAKNTVLSSAMAEMMEHDGMRYVDDPRRADYLVVNTCGFIEAARAESLTAMKELNRIKRRSQKLVAVGCLSQRYAELIASEVRGVDAILGTQRWEEILTTVQNLRDKAPGKLTPAEEILATEPEPVHQVAILGASAYVRIADGCRRSCAFCAIPLIKGTLVSRPMDAILRDLHYLEEDGVQEAILIAQDTTDYGHDRGMKDGISQLLRRILAETGIPWLRLLYTFPGFVSPALIDLMASEERLLPYLDIPLQHGDADILRGMSRPADLDWVHRTIGTLRDKIPHLALRSTFIVGYPGEGEAEFQRLLDFLQEIQFDRVGAFAYSHEIGTPADPLGDPVSADEKADRLQRLMELQESISLRKNQAWIGKQLDCLIEGVDEGISVGRSFRDAPEIDGYVIVEGIAPLGEIVPVTITGAMTHDLMGRLTK